MESILNFLKSGVTNVCPKVVISSKPEAEGLKKASALGIPTKIVSMELKGWDYDKELVSILQKYKMRIMNIHPSLLPSFPGLNSQKKAYDYGVKVTGCTVHFVDEGLDSGPIIAQKQVPVLDSDTYETLSERILQQEHILYPYCIKLFSEDKLVVKGRRVIVTL